MKKGKGIILVLAIIAIIAVIFLLQSNNQEQIVDNNQIIIQNEEEIKEDNEKIFGTKEGEFATDLEFATFEGELVKFSDYQGKIAVINSWAAWCPFCIEEMPLMQRISNENEEVITLFIHRTATESKSKTTPFLNDFESEEIPITDPLLEDKNDNFYKTFFGFGMPVTIILDKEGKIVDKKIGAYTEEELNQEINKIK